MKKIGGKPGYWKQWITATQFTWNKLEGTETFLEQIVHLKTNTNFYSPTHVFYATEWTKTLADWFLYLKAGAKFAKIRKLFFSSRHGDQRCCMIISVAQAIVKGPEIGG